MMNHKHTEESKSKISKNSAHYWLGKKRSVEDREKFKKSHIGLKYPNRKSPIYTKGWEKGHIPWNKGLKGIHCSPKTEFKKGQNAGSKNPSWKGGITNVMHLLRKSDNYKEWRSKVFKRDNYTCYECGKKGGRIEAHHLFPFNEFIQWRFLVMNGITLCENCHAKIRSKTKEKEYLKEIFTRRVNMGIAVVDI